MQNQKAKTKIHIIVHIRLNERLFYVEMAKIPSIPVCQRYEKMNYCSIRCW